MTLRVLDPGLHSLLVDTGRYSSRSLGVAIGGAADRTSLTMGNALVGNGANTVALEVSLRGPTLQAHTALGCIMFGAEFEMSSDRQTLSSNMSFSLAPGEILRIGGARRGMRGYLCVPGGFQSPKVLGSRSALAPLGAGAELVCASSTVSKRFLAAAAPCTWSDDAVHKLRFVPGAQADNFDLAVFASQEFTVTAASNRMGLRLLGAPLPPSGEELSSEPVCPGTVQVTNNGQCIVLGIDGQTIGGYPKIAHVIQADLDRLGQLRPNQRIQFLPVTLAEAETAWVCQRAELLTWQARLAVRLDCSGILDGPSL